jgi:hypothetical protein
MNDREFFLARRKEEKDVFLRVLRAVPERLDYTPHERSPTAGQILGTLVGEHATCCELVATGKTSFKPASIGSVAQAAADFERHWDDLDARTAALDDAGWEKNGQFFSGGKMVSERPIGGFLWFILFDAIHHRGQLAAYIRPMGGTVPSIYGPSADSRRA